VSTTIGILLFEGAEELDFVGPWEVFCMAAMGRDDVHVVTIAERAKPLRCAKGLRVIPDVDFDDAPALDVVVIPGGEGTRKEVQNQRLLEWLRKVGESCTWITSVCTGAALLHAAGLASGKRLTTHWGYLGALRAAAPECEVLERVRYVRDGKLVSAAGVSAGIDMSLWLVGQIWGVEHARRTQHFMEYNPAPPYAAEVEGREEA
jgi:transcriptional regulator GlxA family with amidase domain